jgi:hypothetical protein
MNRSLGLLCGLVAAMIAGAVARNILHERTPDVTSGKFLSKIADEVNKNVPMTIDEGTVLINVSGSDGLLAYNCRLVNIARVDLDLNAFKREMKPQITNAACTSPDLRSKFLDKGVTLRYSYVDRNDAHVAAIDVTRADCSD